VWAEASSKAIKDEFSDLPVSRQRKYQLRMQQDRRCIICGESAVGSIFCLNHLVAKREVTLRLRVCPSNQRRCRGFNCAPPSARSAGIAGDSRLRSQLPAVSLPEDQYKYDDEDNDAKRNIHNMLSLMMTAHPSPFTDYQA
jgi:hypothetical protein